jgi:hypothetical protein
MMINEGVPHGSATEADATGFVNKVDEHNSYIYSTRTKDTVNECMRLMGKNIASFVLANDTYTFSLRGNIRRRPNEIIKFGFNPASKDGSVTNRTVGEAIRILNNAGLKYDVNTKDMNAIVSAQMPAPGETLVEKSLIKLYLEGNDTRFNTIVPDVKNLDIVSATKRLSDASLNIKISGSGVSVYQDPPAGTSVEQGSVIRVEFRTVGIDVQ